jgi:hypothetical protein
MKGDVRKAEPVVQQVGDYDMCQRKTLGFSLKKFKVE